MAMLRVTVLVEVAPVVLGTDLTVRTLLNSGSNIGNTLFVLEALLSRMELVFFLNLVTYLSFGLLLFDLLRLAALLRFFDVGLQGFVNITHYSKQKEGVIVFAKHAAVLG